MKVGYGNRIVIFGAVSVLGILFSIVNYSI